MKLRRLLAGMMSLSLLLFNIGYLPVNADEATEDTKQHIETPVITPDIKISDELYQVMDETSEEYIPVVLWLDDVDGEQIEAEIFESIGYGINDLETKYIPPSDELLDSLAAATLDDSDNALEQLMNEHLVETKALRNIENEKTELYISTKLDIVAKENIANSEEVLSVLNVDNKSVGFISSYAPMIICLMSPEEIKNASLDEKVTEITFYEPLDPTECVIDMGTTKETVGIDRINNRTTLTGDGVSIGIYEDNLVSSAYYSTNGLHSERVHILSTSSGTGAFHPSWCAGIAAGDYGVAPQADIYSASGTDDDPFNWDNYDEVTMSKLEELILYSDIISMSFSWSGQGDTYNNYSKYMDYLVRNCNITIVCSSGNYNEYISAPGAAYNTICVNGFVDNYNGTTANMVNDYTYNHGSRCFKPDVVGPSLNNGTSTATPYIAGMIALLYEYKPSLKALPETTKAILLASVHEKCAKLLNSDGTITDLGESMTNGLTNRQGAGIPNMYRMISIAAQHSYGNGVLNADNSYQRYINFVQPQYGSNYINFSLAFLQNNIPTDNSDGYILDYDLRLTCGSGTKLSSQPKSSTELAYMSTGYGRNYSARIYRYGSLTDSVRYGYAWSTDDTVFIDNATEQGKYYLKNYKSGMYLKADTSGSHSTQVSSAVSDASVWKLTSSGSRYYLASISRLLQGVGLGTAINSTFYYADESNGSSVTAVNLIADSATGTYSFIRTVNGQTYALGINGNATTSGAYLAWSKYGTSNASQKWYLETIIERVGDVNVDGQINSSDVTNLNKYLAGLVTLNYTQLYNADVNKDGRVNAQDSIALNQLIADL